MALRRVLGVAFNQSNVTDATDSEDLDAIHAAAIGNFVAWARRKAYAGQLLDAARISARRANATGLVSILNVAQARKYIGYQKSCATQNNDDNG